MSSRSIRGADISSMPMVWRTAVDSGMLEDQKAPCRQSVVLDGKGYPAGDVKLRSMSKTHTLLSIPRDNLVIGHLRVNV